MAKKNNNSDIASFDKNDTSNKLQNAFYFGKENFKWMFIGMAFIVIGFLLMMGQGANTRPDGTFNPNYWNDGIFSVVRIRIAPLLVITGFVIEAYAILKRKKN